jgi:hypothetical protein
MLRIVESGDVRDDGWLDLDDLNELGLVHGVRTERHLLRPFDLLVTARTASIQVALVPPEVSRTVAGVTFCWWCERSDRNPVWDTGFGTASLHPLAGRSSPRG